MGSFFSTYHEILRVSILGPIQFKIVINDLIISFKKQKFVILLMTLPYTHAH